MRKLLLSLAALFSVAGLHAGAPVQEKNVVEVAQSNSDFSTLAQALVAADLVGNLQGEGPFTIFAPTNEAFRKLPPGTVEELLKPENKAKLRSILTYHVVVGKLLGKDVKSGQVRTVNGKDITIDVEGGQVKVNNAKVIKTDVIGSNGVIHVIDTVLIP